MIVLAIPQPPTSNTVFANSKSGAGRYKTDKYKAWREDAGWAIQQQLRNKAEKSIPGNIVVALEVGPPRRGDIDNRIKAVLDVLQDKNVIENDRLVDKITAWWGEETRVVVKASK